MGSCMSSQSPGTPAAAAYGGTTAVASASATSSSAFDWKSCRGWRSEKKRRKEEERNGGGAIGGELSDRWLASSGGGGLLEEDIHRVPGRKFLNGATEVACLFTQQGKKGFNQDAMLVWENFASRSDTIFCGVFDGHGPFGHLVARKVRDSLPLKLCAEWIGNVSGHNSPSQNGFLPGSANFEESTSVIIDDEWAEPVDADENEKLPEMYLTLKQSLLKASRLMDKELKVQPRIDCFCSGTTAVTIVKQGQDLVVGNVGDSRAIMGRRDEDNNLVAVQLTIDLKPNLPKEASRIQQCKGRVFALQDEPEVARVWLPNSDSPGLAMARAFGDFCLKDYGLISIPDVSYHHLTEKDEFIVLATDGVWDVLSNKEVVDIVASAPTRTTAARAVVDCAVRAWRLKFPTSKIDDCAVVCLFLDPQLPFSQTQENNSRKAPPTEPVETTALVSTDLDVNGQEGISGSVSGGSQISSVERLNTLYDAREIVAVSGEPKKIKVPERCQSTVSLSDCMSTTEEEWSALEGVTRVNSLMNLPRFLSGNKRLSIWRKRF
ncbi:probable protein phosphatase 2C 66 isoform X2 [Phoenix dactylifera]|uniref:protein-serine/threonine phosphatase n=1 Tax=Phoenix dactylifera TaxID=42345 RepID=A0A8B7BPX6_PHODC|nr:probable protein phosphatase 2C 66 isoform X2 [Phoenix dactylifera]